MTQSHRRSAQRRLLFLTYGFPPVRRAGSVRTWNIAKYLARTGWAVAVVTPEPSLFQNIERSETATANLVLEGITRITTEHRWRWLAANEGLKCANTGLSWFVGGLARRTAQHFGIEPTVGWVLPAERAGKTFQPGNVDLLLASGPPFTAFPLAKRLAGRLRCPYVLDYRDLWSRHLHNPAPHAVQVEASAIDGSAAITIVSPSWRTVMGKQFGVASKIHVVSNGYDVDELASVKPHAFGHKAIVYTGSLWTPKRVISPLMAALRRLSTTSSDSPWLFHYYGKHGRHVQEQARQFGVTDRVMLHGQVPRSEALAAVKGAAAAVVITSIEDNASLEDNGMITGKIFEAIGLGTSTLLIGPPGSDANVVAEVTGLARMFAPTDTDGIASFLRHTLTGHLLQPRDTAAYAWDTIVKGLDTVLCSALA